MPIDFCLALDDASPPLDRPLKCVYSDGTPVETGPPEGECPASDPRQPFCGGVCGTERRCPATPEFGDTERHQPCAGVSDQRAFGVCTYTRHRCVSSDPDFNQRYLFFCRSHYGEPCACMVPHPQTNEPEWQQGFVVLESVCHRYSEEHGDLAECRNADWEVIPD